VRARRAATVVDAFHRRPESAIAGEFDSSTKQVARDRLGAAQPALQQILLAESHALIEQRAARAHQP